MKSPNPLATWHKIYDGVWQYCSADYKPYGTVMEKDGKFIWHAIVVAEFRLPYYHDIPSGLAISLEWAKKIVETICTATGTADRALDAKEEVQKKYLEDGLALEDDANAWLQSQAEERAVKLNGAE